MDRSRWFSYWHGQYNKPFHRNRLRYPSHLVDDQHLNSTVFLAFFLWFVGWFTGNMGRTNYLIYNCHTYDNALTKLADILITRAISAIFCYIRVNSNRWHNCIKMCNFDLCEYLMWLIYYSELKTDRYFRFSPLILVRILLSHSNSFKKHSIENLFTTHPIGRNFLSQCLIPF